MPRCRTCPHDERDHFTDEYGRAACMGGGSDPCTDPDCRTCADDVYLTDSPTHDHVRCTCHTTPRAKYRSR